MKKVRIVPYRGSVEGKYQIEYKEGFFSYWKLAFGNAITFTAEEAKKKAKELLELLNFEGTSTSNSNSTNNTYYSDNLYKPFNFVKSTIAKTENDNDGTDISKKISEAEKEFETVEKSMNDLFSRL